jgi:hypothetical protein
MGYCEACRFNPIYMSESLNAWRVQVRGEPLQRGMMKGWQKRVSDYWRRMFEASGSEAAFRCVGHGPRRDSSTDEDHHLLLRHLLEKHDLGGQNTCDAKVCCFIVPHAPLARLFNQAEDAELMQRFPR